MTDAMEWKVEQLAKVVITSIVDASILNCRDKRYSICPVCLFELCFQRQPSPACTPGVVAASKRAEAVEYRCGELLQSTS